MGYREKCACLLAVAKVARRGGRRLVTAVAVAAEQNRARRERQCTTGRNRAHSWGDD